MTNHAGARSRAAVKKRKTVARHGLRQCCASFGARLPACLPARFLRFPRDSRAAIKWKRAASSLRRVMSGGGIFHKTRGEPAMCVCVPERARYALHNFGACVLNPRASVTSVWMASLFIKVCLVNAQRGRERERELMPRGEDGVAAAARYFTLYTVFVFSAVGI